METFARVIAITFFVSLCIGLISRARLDRERWIDIAVVSGGVFVVSAAVFRDLLAGLALAVWIATCTFAVIIIFPHALRAWARARPVLAAARRYVGLGSAVVLLVLTAGCGAVVRPALLAVNDASAALNKRVCETREARKKEADRKPCYASVAEEEAKATAKKAERRREYNRRTDAEDERMVAALSAEERRVAGEISRELGFRAVASRDGGDGYTATALWVADLILDAQKFESELCNRADPAWGFPGPVRAAAAIGASQAITIRFPGSSYQCLPGVGRIVAGNREMTFAGGNLVVFRRTATTIVTVALEGDTARVSAEDGRGQSVTFVVDRARPSRSRFTDINLSARADSGRASETVAAQRGRGVRLMATATRNEMISAADRLYQKTVGSAKNKQTMIAWANKLLLDPSARDLVARAAAR